MPDRFSFAPISIKDADEIVRIYNSNPVFLQNHLGATEVSAEFVLEEFQEMGKVGFSSTKIIDNSTGETIGICDFRIGDTVYLSLLMLDGVLQGKGLGSDIYKVFEQKATKDKAGFIRIDVVDSYSGNAVGFWKKQGFESQGITQLNWHGKQSHAQIMRKVL